MAAKHFSGFWVGKESGAPSLVGSAFRTGMNFLERNARRILAILLLAFVVLSVFSCFVIGSIGVGGVTLGGGTPQPDGASGYDATATYGADLFYLQLTAISGQQSP